MSNSGGETKPGLNLGPLGNLNLTDTHSATAFMLSPAGYLATQGFFGQAAKEGTDNFMDRSGLSNVGGEINQNNRKRQEEWQGLVTKNAKTDQENAWAAANKAAQSADIAGSKAAAIRPTPGVNSTDTLNYKNPKGDTTDFLGL